MKLFLLRAIFLCCLLSVLLQCSSDQSRGLAPLQLSAKAIAADTSFQRVVALTTDMRDVLYNTLRDAHSEPKRLATNKRIRSLLNRNNNDSLVMAIKLLGFRDVNQYLNHLSQLMRAKASLAKLGIFLERTPLPILTEAIQLTSRHTYPVIFKKPAARGAGDICYDCRFNNCDECGPGMNNEESNDDEWDGPGYNCRQSAEAKRQNAIAQAENMFYVAVIGCGGSAWAAGEIACGATMVTIVGAPISPGVGAGVTCFVATTCATFAYVDYRLKIQQAELDYQATIAGCPR